jgi:hypothetical protein
VVVEVIRGLARMKAGSYHGDRREGVLGTKLLHMLAIVIGGRECRLDNTVAADQAGHLGYLVCLPKITVLLRMKSRPQVM